MGTFILDTSLLAGARGEFGYDEETIEDRGRSIILNWSSTGADQDMELFGYSIRFTPAESEPKEHA